MNLKSYREFVGMERIDENLDKSKKFLKERELIKRAAKELGFINDDMAWKIKEGEKKTLLFSDFTEEQVTKLKEKLKEIRLSDTEIRNLEKDPEFIKLKGLLSSNMGYLYNFVYMYYVEMTPLNEIENMYNQLLDYKNILDKLKTIPEVGRAFDASFIDTSIPNDKEHRTNSEILADGLERLGEYRIVKKVVDTLPRKLKQSYEEASILQREQMAEVAKAFEDLPEEMTPDGITKKERIWKNFFGEMRIDGDEFLPDGSKNPNFGKNVYKSRLRRFEEMDNPIREFLKAAKAHLEASLTDGYNERIEKIEKCNDKFGVMGCSVVSHVGGIMIVQVNSWAANNFLNSHCNHCIVNYQSYWNSYLGDYNKQYYIYNFNISSLEDLSTIGITIKPDRTWDSGACQSMRNNSIGGRFKKILKDWESEYGIDIDLFGELKPMTKEEIDKRQRAKIAEREIVKKGITIEQIKQYVTEDGADINKDSAKALINAVEEDDLEKIKLCLSLGASPNLAKDSDSAIARASSLEVIKLLVQYGSDITGQVFGNIVDNMEALEFCLRDGLDPNFSDNLSLRKVAKGTYKSKDDIGRSYFDAFKMLLKYGVTLFDKNGRNAILKYAAEYGRMDIIRHLQENGYFKQFKKYESPDNPGDFQEAIKWIAHARRLNDELRTEIIDYLKLHDKK